MGFRARPRVSFHNYAWKERWCEKKFWWFVGFSHNLKLSSVSCLGCCCWHPVLPIYQARSLRSDQELRTVEGDLVPTWGQARPNWWLLPSPDSILPSRFFPNWYCKCQRFPSPLRGSVECRHSGLEGKTAWSQGWGGHGQGQDAWDFPQPHADPGPWRGPPASSFLFSAT